MNWFKNLSFPKKLLIVMGSLILVNILGLAAIIYYGYKEGSVGSLVEDYTRPFSSGRVLTYEEEKEKIIEECTKQIKEDPNNAKAYAKRGETYYWKGDYPKAISDLSNAIKLNDKNSEWYRRRGKAYDFNDQDEKAIADFSRAIYLNPMKVDVYIDRAGSYKDMGDNKKALSDYDKAISLSKEPAEYLVKRAKLYSDLEKYDKAFDDLNKAAAIKDEEKKYYVVEAIRERMYLHKKRKQWHQALQDCQLWIKRDPDSVWAYEQRAEIHLALKQKEKAKFDWQCAVKIATEEIKKDGEEQSRFSFDNRADNYERLGKKELAKADWKVACKLYLQDDDLSDSDLNEAMELSEQVDDKQFTEKLFADHIKQLDKLIQYDTKNTKLLARRGTCYKVIGDDKRAEADWKKALSLLEANPRPDDDDYFDEYQAISKKLDYKKGIEKIARRSIEKYKRQLKTNPKNDKAYHYLGIEYRDLKQFDKAYQSFSEAIKLKSKNEHYYWHRGEISEKRKKFSEAIKDYSKASKLDGSVSNYVALSRVYQKSGNNDEAISKATKAIQLDDTKGGAFYWRGQAYKSLGKAKLSGADLKKAKELNYKPEKEKE